MSLTAYVSIGNSDDKLSQRQWCEFVNTVEEAFDEERWRVHGAWFSRPDAAWQNACWCIELLGNTRSYFRLRRELREIAATFNQDSITFAKAEVEFLFTTDPALNNPETPEAKVRIKRPPRVVLEELS